MAEFKVDSKEFDRLSGYISEIGEEAEEIINNYLHNEGGNLAIPSIKDKINIGKSSHSKRQGKGHARRVKSIKIVPFNLGFIAKNEKGYGYLYFPDEGQGTSKHNNPQDIFERGINDVRDTIITGIEDSLIKKLGGE